ncbi:unnamed protein product [Discula destructiva]
MGYRDGQSGPVDGVYPPTIHTTAPSGSIHAIEHLLSGRAPKADVNSDSTVVGIVENGEDAEKKQGSYLGLDSSDAPQTVRDEYGAPKLDPRALDYERINPDVYAPPKTDKGDVPNAMWPFGLSHNSLGSDPGAGDARVQNVDNLPSATAMAGADLKLGPNAYREMHWHRANEWALMLQGCVRLSSVTDEGQTFVDDICAGDVWYFPSGVPHSIQAFKEGAEFLLIFDDGDFRADGTFLASEMMMRTPVSVLAKNFEADPSAFKKIPQHDLGVSVNPVVFRSLPFSQRARAEKVLQMFNGPPQVKIIGKAQNLTSSAGSLDGTTKSQTYHWSLQQPYDTPGGSFKILDSSTFPVAENFAVALFTIKPGAMREIHWHTTSPEWNYFLQGSARITVFAAPSAARTFDFAAGSVGYIPQGSSHYVENTGTEDVVFLEVLQAKKFTDISAAQWLALTPKQVVQDHFHFPDGLWEKLPKEKTWLKPGNPSLTEAILQSSDSSPAHPAAPPAGEEDGDPLSGEVAERRTVTFFA